MENNPSLVPLDCIGSAIRLVRGQKVLLDSDLAELYGMETKRLNEQVRRNLCRFPPDFMFQLNTNEIFKLNRSQIVTGSNLRCQFGISKFGCRSRSQFVILNAVRN
jgi:hypothetical protein